MLIEKVVERVEATEKELHKLGNKINNHVIQISLGEKRIELLNEHREKHANDILLIKSQQDHSTTAMEKLSRAIDNLTVEITGLFTIKNMILGVFAALSFLTVAFLALLKLFMDYYK
jgi:chromosome segregation ATPase